MGEDHPSLATAHNILEQRRIVQARSPMANVSSDGHEDDDLQIVHLAYQIREFSDPWKARESLERLQQYDKANNTDLYPRVIAYLRRTAPDSPPPSRLNAPVTLETLETISPRHAPRSVGRLSTVGGSSRRPPRDNDDDNDQYGRDSQNVTQRMGSLSTSEQLRSDRARPQMASTLQTSDQQDNDPQIVDLARRVMGLTDPGNVKEALSNLRRYSETHNSDLYPRVIAYLRRTAPSIVPTNRSDAQIASETLSKAHASTSLDNTRQVTQSFAERDSESLVEIFSERLADDLQNINFCSIPSQLAEFFKDILGSFAIFKDHRARTRHEKKEAESFRRSSDSISELVATMLASRDTEISTNARKESTTTTDSIVVPWERIKSHKPWIDAFNESQMSLDTDEASDAREESSETVHSLFRSDQYDWLLRRIRSGLKMDIAQAEHLSSVRHAFTKHITAQLASDHSNIQEMTVEVDWCPQTYMIAEFGSIVDLGATIVLVGTSTQAYATTCREYLTRVWPAMGCSVLDAIQDLCNMASSSVEGRIGGMDLQLDILQGKTHINASGELVSLCDLFEILVWMSSACRSSIGSFTVALCRPMVIENGSVDLHFRISHSSSPIPYDRSATPEGDCWHGMFSNASIAEGYPIPIRQNKEIGLEISFEMMVALARTPSKMIYEGYVVLKGYNSMLIPTRKRDKCVEWHFIVNEDYQDRISYNEGLKHSSFTTLDEVIFDGALHFVGWCRNARVTAGTSEAAYSEIKTSDSESLNGAIQIKNEISFSAGKVPGPTFLIGKKESPLRLTSTRFEHKIYGAMYWTVLFSDTAARRHWLLDGATALLHLVRAYLDMGHRMRINADIVNDMWYPLEFNTPNSAYDVLVHEQNRSLNVNARQRPKSRAVTGPHEVASDGGTHWPVEELILQQWHALELLYDRSKRSGIRETHAVTSRGRSHEGFEFKDFINGETTCLPRKINLAEQSAEWLNFTRNIGTINLLGSGFGDLIRPEDFLQCSFCPLGRQMPEGRDLLGIPMAVLDNIVHKYGRHTKRSVHLADGMYWTDPERYFQKCHASATSASDCNSLITKLDKKAASPEMESEQHEIFRSHRTGAIIMGNYPKVHKNNLSISQSIPLASVSRQLRAATGVKQDVRDVDLRQTQEDLRNRNKAKD